MNHTVWYVYEVFARFLYVIVCFSYIYIHNHIWEISKRRSSNLLTFTRSATHGALFPEPVRCTGALGAGAAEARALTEKMPCSKRPLRLRKKTGGRIWVFPKIGVPFPPKWMVKIMENPIKMDDCGSVKKQWTTWHDWRWVYCPAEWPEKAEALHRKPKYLPGGKLGRQKQSKSNGENRILSCLPVSSNILIYNICQASNLQW